MAQKDNIATIKTVLFHPRRIIPAKVEVAAVKTGIGIHVVGMPDNKAKELLLRVVTAMQALGYRLPGQKIVISISADNDADGVIDAATRKTILRWSMLDLPVAIALLAATKQITIVGQERTIFTGELGLDGKLRKPLVDFSALLSYARDNDVDIVAPPIPGLFTKRCLSEITADEELVIQESRI